MGILLMQCGYAQDTTVSTHAPITIRPTTDFDQRFYYVPNERQNVWGYRVGILINDKFKMGVGGYYMNEYAEKEITTPTGTGNALINKKIYLGTIYYEPYLIRKDLWESSLVFETGYGRTVNTITTEKDDNQFSKVNGLLIPAGIGLSVNLKLPTILKIECFRWVGINAMVGYRAAVYQQDKQYQYNGAYWSLSGAIFLDRMVEDYHSWRRHRAISRHNRMIKLSY